jgi:ribosomal protein S18 acetylase RimI-like enzyme
MIIRGVTGDDDAALLGFLGRVPDSDRNFFKQDISDPEIVAHWLHDPSSRRLVAVAQDDTIIATVAVIQGIGWSSHVGELELIVLPAHRRQGLGRDLAHRGLLEAVGLGLTHIYVEVAAQQTALVAMFGRLGFEPEALLRDFIRDRNGNHHDLLMLTHRVQETWSELLTIGADQP